MKAQSKIIDEFTSRILRQIFFEIDREPDTDGLILFPIVEAELRQFAAELTERQPDTSY